jgi:hypothetical protein
MVSTCKSAFYKVNFSVMRCYAVMRRVSEALSAFSESQSPDWRKPQKDTFTPVCGAQTNLLLFEAS